MDFQQIRDFVNPAVAQATGMQEVENLSMPVPVAYVPVQLVIDGALSLTSENPVQNKVIAVAIQNLDGRITAIEGQFSEGVTEAVNNWLAAHPEATTTVQDGAITYAKLDTNLKAEVDQIDGLKSTIIYQSKLTVENIVTPTLEQYSGLSLEWIANGMLKITGTSTSGIAVKIASMSVKSGNKYRFRLFSGQYPDGVYLYLTNINGSTTWIRAPYEWEENADRTVDLRLYVDTAGITINETFIFAISTEKTNAELETDTNNIFQRINPIAQHDLTGMADNFTIGSIYSVNSDGKVNVYASQVHRVTMKNATRFLYDVTMTAAPGYRFGPRLLENGAFVDKGWQTKYKIPANTFFVLQISTTDDSQYADIPVFLQKITTDQIVTTIATPFYKSERYNKAAFGFNTAVKSIAHQGLRLFAPANTRPAFIDAKKYGYNFIETDARTTSDGVIVLNHDDNIATTGDFYDITSGTPVLVTTEKLISQTPYFELYNNYDIRLNTEDGFAGNKIMTLDDLLILCKKINLHPYIELKYANGIGIITTKAVEVAEKIKKYGMIKQCSVFTSADHLLTGIKNAGYTTLRIGFLHMAAFNTNAVNVYNALKTDFNDMFVDVPCDLQTQESIDLAITNNIPLEAYNVTAERLETISPYYTGYTADSVITSQYFYDSVMV